MTSSVRRAACGVRRHWTAVRRAACGVEAGARSASVWLWYLGPDQHFVQHPVNAARRTSERSERPHPAQVSAANDRTPHGFLLTILAMMLILLTGSGTIHAADPWDALSDAAEEKEPLAAQKRLEALLLEQPSFYPAHFNLGTLLMEVDRDRAATHFEHATSSPSTELAHDAWYNLALVRWKQGRLDDALIAAGKAVEIDGKAPDTLKLRDELRRVVLYRANEARKKTEAEAKKLRLPASDLPEAHVGEPYDTRIHAAGGAGGYRFALGLPPTPATSTPLKSGATPAPAPAPTAKTSPPPPTLPTGLTLDADGRLHGTPTKDGRFPLALVVSDQAKDSVSGTLMLVIQPAPAITTTELPEAILGAPYEALIDVVGLDRPTWTISGLPPGISASTEPGPQLRLSGTPTQATKATLILRADDGKRQAARGGPGAPAPLILTVSDSFAPDLAVLPPATAWAPYTHQLGVRGRPQHYRWSSPGAGGLKLDAQGLVSGTPEQAGDLPLPLTINAEDKRSRTHTVRVPVNPPPVIEEPQPLQFTVGQPANRPLSVSGGTAPYQWQIAEGVLPKGLRLDADGTVRGVAGEPGEVDVTVAVSDRWQARSQHQIHVTVIEKTDQGSVNAITVSATQNLRDMGLSWNAAFTRTSATEVSPLTSSTASSNWVPCHASFALPTQ